METKKETKTYVKHACTVCKHEYRADNLMRHIFTHRNDMTTFIDPDRLKHCVDNRFPIMFPNEKEWIMCLICRKTAHANGRGTSVNDFVKTYSTLHSKCIACFETVKDLYDTPKNSIAEVAVIDNTELLDLRKKYALLQAEHEDLTDAYGAVTEDSSEKINNLTLSNNNMIKATNDLIKLIKEHITDEDLLELFEEQIRDCCSSMPDHE